MIDLKKGMALIKPVKGLDISCSNCKKTMISTDGFLPLIGPLDIILCECGHDVSDELRFLLVKETDNP